jgi:rhodanese-related sulfurtransferase
MYKPHSRPTPGRSAQLAALTAALALAAGAAQAATSVLINPGDVGEQSRYTTFTQLRDAALPALKREKLAEPHAAMSTDAGADLAATRSRLHDVFVAPAHVIGSAVRYGYLPLMGLERPVQAVLVALKTNPATSLATAAGMKLGLPLQDSVVTYLLRGEVNAAGSTLKRHFKPGLESRYQEALLICLQIRQCEVVVVERALFERWVAAGEPVKALAQSKAVPGMSVAVKPGTPAAAAADALRGALVAGFNGGAAAAALGRPVAVEAKAFEYVSTLGYFTPRALPGASVVDAAGAARLMAAGATYIDTRTEAEFKAGHAAGARLVPYHEKSHKDADFDAALDKFDLSQLPAERDTPLLLACNGAECWKSFKASQAAIKAGYRQVHWFRGGFPEWRAAGMKIESN